MRNSIEVNLDSGDEWYPVYSFETVEDTLADEYSSFSYRTHKTVQVPVEVVERWKRVFVEFEQVQTELRELQ